MAYIPHIGYNRIMGRECGTCTSCCDGTLSGDIRGHEMGYGVPCFFVQIGKGCVDYENRPQDPCRGYSCGWIIDPDIPEEFKPEKTGVIIDFYDIDNIKYFRLSQKEDSKLTVEILSWAMIYSNQRQYNFSWKYNDITYWIGSEEFSIAMMAKYG